MPTYVYETVPRDEAEAPARFEIRQPITANALTKHPGTGQPVRRVITGGAGFLMDGATKHDSAPECPPSGCCGGGACGMP